MKYIALAIVGLSFVSSISFAEESSFASESVSASRSGAVATSAPSGAETALDTKCGGGFDSKKVATCGFGALRTRVKAKGKECVKDLMKTLCEDSMWKDLGLQQRIQRVTKLAQKQATPRGVDFQAITCLSRRESIWFEPGIITFGACHMETTDQGLGQVVFTTFKDMVAHGFKSTIDPFNKPPYTTDAKLLFEAMALSAELQVEVSAAVFAVKLRSAKGDYTKAFGFYNGSAKKEEYGKMVGACYDCAKKKMAANLTPDQQAKTNIDECLDQTMGGYGTDFSFTAFANTCSGGDPQTWKWPYWVKRGIDPTLRGLDAATHLPVPPTPTPVPTPTPAPVTAKGAKK